MTKPLSREELARLRAVAEAATQDGHHMARFPDSDAAEYFRALVAHGDGPIWGVVIPDGDEDLNESALWVAITGNGPTSEANARFGVMCDPPTVMRLLDMVERQAEALADGIVNTVMDASDAVAAAVAEEREACAAMVEHFAGHRVYGPNMSAGVRRLADAIRARSQR